MIKKSMMITTWLLIFFTLSLCLSFSLHRLRIQRAAQSDSGNYSCNDVFFYLNQAFSLMPLLCINSQFFLSLTHKHLGVPTIAKSASVFVNVISGKWADKLNFISLDLWICVKFILKIALFMLSLNKNGTSTRN